MRPQAPPGALRLTPAEASLLEAFSGGSAVAAAVGRTPSPEGSEALAALVADEALVLDGADPWRLRGPSRSDVPWDAWERRWFAHAAQALEASDIPEGYKETARLLGSCRAVEQKSYEAVFPEVSPLSACNLTCDALSELGVEPAPARKDHSFFLVDSMLRDARFQVSGDLRAAMEGALGPFLALVGMRAWEWEKDVLLPRLTEAVPRGGAAPLAEALGWVSSWAREWRGPFQGDVRPDFRVDHDPDEHILGLSELRLPDEYDRWRADKRLVSCVDLMVAGDRKSIAEGRWRLVLNEAHSSGDGMPETMHIPWTSYATEGGFTASHVEEVFGPDLLALQPLLPTKQAHSIAWQLRGAGLAVRSFGTASAWEGPVRPVAELSLERTEAGFQVTDGRRRWALLTVDLALGSLRGVRYSPLTLAGRVAQLAGVEGVRADDGVTILPEIVLDELTVCRRQHVVPAGMLRRALNGAEGLDLLHAADALRDRLDLSRFVFVSLFKEKPFLCDLESLFSMEVLAHAQRHNTRDVILSEMDPAPEDLWLEVAGAPVASELRFAATLDGVDYRRSGEPVLRV